MQIVRFNMDPLSEILSLLKLEGLVSGGFFIPPDTGLEFKQYTGIKCYAVVDGCCWVSIKGEPEPIFLKTGDCVFLTPGIPFCLASSAVFERKPFIPPEKQPGEILMMKALQGGAFILGGRFTYSDGYANTLLQCLPSAVHISEGAGTKVMRNALECLSDELYSPQPGSDLITQQLVQIMLVQALRIFLQKEGGERVGWLFALSDPQLKSALSLMHADPAFPWTLQELASRVGMSRTVFTKKFKNKVGTTPMKYLAKWRMLLAAERLRSSQESITKISFLAGYDTDSAFGRAFKKEWGCSPREHRHNSRNKLLATYN